MGRETGEFNQILIDRISPQDARALKGFAGSASLKGTGFGHFCGFFCRGPIAKTTICWAACMLSIG